MFHLETLGLLLRNKEFLRPIFFLFLCPAANSDQLVPYDLSEMSCLSRVQGAVCKAVLHQTILLFVVYIAVKLFINHNFNLK